MKTASKAKNRAAKTVARRADQQPLGAQTRVLLGARWAVDDDDRRSLAAIAEALSQVGVAGRVWRPFEDSLADFHFLHLLGSSAEFLRIVASARRSGLRVVLSPQSWQIAPSGSQARGWARRAAAWLANGGRSLFARAPAWQVELYKSVDMLLPNSNLEAQRLSRRFRIPLDHFRVVPHGVDPKLADADPQLFRDLSGLDGFVLYVGSIEPKNQQLGFVWAMRSLDVPVVVLGDATAEFQWYLEECRRAAGPQIQFFTELAGSDSLLASAYAACDCMVVGCNVAGAERVALAAGASGTPLVLFEGGCDSEYFGQQAIYVRPDDVAGIRRGAQAALDRKRSRNLAEHVRTYFSWKAVARTLRDAYGQIDRTATAAVSEARCT